MNPDHSKQLQFTEFDYLMTDPHLQMMKATLPYMQLPQQRIFSMIIKIQELNKTMELFSGGDLSAMGLSNFSSQKTSPMEMLQAMKPYAGPKERDMIEMMENLQIMMQAMQTQP